VPSFLIKFQYELFVRYPTYRPTDRHKKSARYADQQQIPYSEVVGVMTNICLPPWGLRIQMNWLQ